MAPFQKTTYPLLCMSEDGEDPQSSFQASGRMYKDPYKMFPKSGSSQPPVIPAPGVRSPLLDSEGTYTPGAQVHTQTHNFEIWGRVTHWLRAFAALKEDPGLLLALIWQPTTIFWPPWVPGMHMVRMQSTHTHGNNLKRQTGYCGSFL